MNAVKTKGVGYFFLYAFLTFLAVCCIVPFGS